MADISILLDTLRVLDTTINVETIITEFHALSEADKDDRRLSTAKKIFPLIFGDNASVQGDIDFSERTKTTWSTSCELSPGIFISPETPQDVGRILALCQFLGLKFSVRGGGHLHNPGFSSNDGGVVISMKNLNAVTVSEDKLTVDIGVGLVWIDVYKALEEHDIAVIGGRQPAIGVAGFLLGGGLSFQNSERGLSCHGVVEFEIVLADSTVAKVNATNNKELFWALKGGGSNFGIVTKVTMSAISNKVWCEGRVYAPKENKKICEAIMEYHKASEKDSKATLIWHTVEEATTLILVYADPVEEQPAIFNVFDEIEPLVSMVPPKIYSILEIVSIFDELTVTEPKSHDIRIMTSMPDLELYNAVEECRLQQIDALKDVPGARVTLTIQPMSPSAFTAGVNQGGDPLGLTAQSQQWLVVLMDWSNPEDDAVVLEASRKIVDLAESVARKNGTYLDFKYSNYCSRDQDPLASYGAENVRKLRSIADAVDPRGVFQKLQNDGWLLSKTV